MADEWFVKAGNMELGPMARRHLDGMARRGEIDPTSPVRHGEKGAWRPAQTVPGLFDEEGAAPSKKGAAKPPKLEDLSRVAREGSASKAEPTAREELEEFFGDLKSSWAPWAVGGGAIAMFATGSYASLIATIVHYGGLLAVVAGLSVFMQHFYGESKLAMAGFWLAAVVAAGAWGWYDTCIDARTVDGAEVRDTVRRFSGAIVKRERTYHTPDYEYRTWGPTLPDGTPHGRWQTFWIKPEENNQKKDENTFWFWKGQPMTEDDWKARQSSS